MRKISHNHPNEKGIISYACGHGRFKYGCINPNLMIDPHILISHYKDKKVVRPFYLYNGNPLLVRWRLPIETTPWSRFRFKKKKTITSWIICVFGRENRFKWFKNRSCKPSIISFLACILCFKHTNLMATNTNRSFPSCCQGSPFYLCILTSCKIQSQIGAKLIWTSWYHR